ncbi:hypothetical protein VP01_1089g5 [Puccinia sorghi]|uniref:Uncharacterized protein n=1 Tax=Puccinia sorghi TaxID=27349 RepID=A0A0L6VT50_9BASI|nr:hypothetical protein VP01_1089g5 [Puccinia sorghi]
MCAHCLHFGSGEYTKPFTQTLHPEQCIIQQDGGCSQLGPIPSNYLLFIGENPSNLFPSSNLCDLTTLPCVCREVCSLHPNTLA